jgi:hypothetical protein
MGRKYGVALIRKWRISIGGKYLFEAISCENGRRSDKALAKALAAWRCNAQYQQASSIGGAGESLAKAKIMQCGGGAAKAAKAQRTPSL